MHVVYKVVFKDRLENGVKPYFYVGSKSNCEFIDGVIIEDKTKKPYYGSSRFEKYNDIVKESDVETKILFSSNNVTYSELISRELEIQKNLSVVENPEYFNLSYAQLNTFSEPGFALYVHKDIPSKRVRLKNDNPKVLNGEFIHINKGRKRSKEVIEKWKNDVARKPKSEDHKKKIGRSGFVMLKNVLTSECKRVNKTELIHYSREDWFNPFTLSITKLDENGRPIKHIKKNNKIKPCSIDGVEYESIKAASETLNITRAIVKNRLNNEKWTTWKN